MKKGKKIKLGVGCRESPGASEATPTRLTGRPRAAISPVEEARDALCVSKALRLLGWETPLGPDVDFDRVPDLLRNSGFSRQLVLVKPAKWGYPGLLDSKRRGSCFEFNAIEVICSCAAFEDKLLLRVYLTDTNTSLHCVAVHAGCIVDPADGAWRPLCPEYFAQLSTGEVLRGWKVAGLCH